MSNIDYHSTANIVPALQDNPKLFLEQSGVLLISWLKEMSFIDEAELKVGNIKSLRFRKAKIKEHKAHNPVQILQTELADDCSTALQYLPQKIGNKPVKLRPSQIRFIENLSHFLSGLDSLSSAPLELIISKATGTGKTLMFLMITQLLATQPNQKIVIVVPHISLGDQTLIKTLEYYPHESVSYFSSSNIDKNKKHRFERGLHGRIVVVVANSLNKFKQELYTSDGVQIACIILDEAHLLRSGNVTSQLAQISNPDTIVLKVSATPDNTRILPVGNKKYKPVLVGNTIHYQDLDSKLSGHVVHSETMQELLESEEICPILWRPVLTEFEFKVTFGELNREGDFAEIPTINFFNAHWDEICKEVFDAYKRDITNGVKIKKIFAACPSIELSHRAAEKFCRDTGKISASISSDESYLFKRGKNGEIIKDKVDAAILIDAYKQGEIDAIFQIRKLREGFDDPEIDCVMMLWFTTLVGAYIQLLGRGTRFLPGKTLKVYEIILGNYHAVNPLIVSQATGFFPNILDVVKDATAASNNSEPQAKNHTQPIDQDIRFIQAIGSGYTHYSEFYKILRDTAELHILKNTLNREMIDQALQKFTSDNAGNIHPLTWSSTKDSQTLYNPSLSLQPDFIKTLLDIYRENRPANPVVTVNEAKNIADVPTLLTTTNIETSSLSTDEKPGIIAQLRYQYSDLIESTTQKFTATVVDRMLANNLRTLKIEQLKEFLSSQEFFAQWLNTIFEPTAFQLPTAPLRTLGQDSFKIRLLQELFKIDALLEIWTSMCRINGLEEIKDLTKLLASSDHKALVYSILDQLVQYRDRRRGGKIDNQIDLIDVASEILLVKYKNSPRLLSSLIEPRLVDIKLQKLLLDKRYKIFNGYEIEKFNSELIKSHSTILEKMLELIKKKSFIGLDLSSQQDLLNHLWTLKYNNESALEFIQRESVSEGKNQAQKLETLFSKAILQSVKRQITKSFLSNKKLENELVDFAGEWLIKSSAQDLILAYRPIYTHLIETLEKYPQLTTAGSWYSKLKSYIFPDNTHTTISDFTQLQDFITYYQNQIDLAVLRLTKRPFTERTIEDTLSHPNQIKKLQQLADIFEIPDAALKEIQASIYNSALQSANKSYANRYLNLSLENLTNAIRVDTETIALKKVLTKGLQTYWDRFQEENNQQKVEINFSSLAQILLRESSDFENLKFYLSSKDSGEFKCKVLSRTAPPDKVLLVTQIFEKELDSLAQFSSQRLKERLNQNLSRIGVLLPTTFENDNFIPKEVLAKWMVSILTTKKLDTIHLELGKVIDSELEKFPNLDFHCFEIYLATRSYIDLSMQDIQLIINLSKPKGFLSIKGKQPELLSMTWQDSKTNVGSILTVAIDTHFYLDQSSGKRYASEIFLQAKNQNTNLEGQKQLDLSNQAPIIINGKSFYEYI